MTHRSVHSQNPLLDCPTLTIASAHKAVFFHGKHIVWSLEWLLVVEVSYIHITSWKRSLIVYIGKEEPSRSKYSSRNKAFVTEEAMYMINEEERERFRHLHTSVFTYYSNWRKATKGKCIFPCMMLKTIQSFPLKTLKKSRIEEIKQCWPGRAIDGARGWKEEIELVLLHNENAECKWPWIFE